ncbi:MAG: hypothetical protein GY817_07860, partial [bacterium]|nr:hypothetical protein [bacterium]
MTIDFLRDDELAYLVCYKNIDEDIDWSNKACYLDRPFYEEIYALSSSIEDDSVLREIAMMSYDDELIVGGQRLTKLHNDLNKVSCDQSNILRD